MSKIGDLLEQRFPGPPLTTHYDDLLSEYQRSGLAPPNMVPQVSSGDDGSLWAHIWEAMLYRYLTNLGFVFRRDRVKKSGQDGPDFGVMHDGRTIWIEAIVPAPEGIPPDYLRSPKPGQIAFRSVPHQEILLRWTGALRYKCQRLQSYRAKGIIEKQDCTVVAINDCRLSDYRPIETGVSGFPFAVEAVFPVGPIAVPISLDGQQPGEAIRTTRYTIRKQNRVDVPTANFLDEGYAGVSALMGSTQRDMLDGKLRMTLVHNPLARMSLPIEILDASKEYVADHEGDEYFLHELHQR